MIDVSHYIDKLEVLKEYMDEKINDVSVVEVRSGSTNNESVFVGYWYSIAKSETFEQFYQSKINPL